MTKFIAHRINKISELNKIKSFDGIELDVRDNNNKLILSHDPGNRGEKFETLLKKVKKKIVFINIKSFGILKKIIPITKNSNFLYRSI